MVGNLVPRDGLDSLSGCLAVHTALDRDQDQGIARTSVDQNLGVAGRMGMAAAAEVAVVAVADMKVVDESDEVAVAPLQGERESRNENRTGCQVVDRLDVAMEADRDMMVVDHSRLTAGVLIVRTGLECSVARCHVDFVGACRRAPGRHNCVTFDHLGGLVDDTRFVTLEGKVFDLKGYMLQVVLHLCSRYRRNHGLKSSRNWCSARTTLSVMPYMHRMYHGGMSYPTSMMPAHKPRCHTHQSTRTVVSSAHSRWWRRATVDPDARTLRLPG